MSQKIGGKLRARYPINDEWSVGVNYTFVRNKLYDVGDNASAAIKEAVPGLPDATSITYYTSSVGYSLIYDTRDNKKRPTSGVYYTVAQDLAGLGGDVRYVRSVGEARGYYAVRDDVTAVGRATGGMIRGWGGQDVRLLDLFYQGDETVRGFAIAGLGPRDTQSANQDALGGRMFYATSRRELLFPIPGVPQDIGLRGAVFADAGSLWSISGTAAAARHRRQYASAARVRRRRARLGFPDRHTPGRLRFSRAQGALRQDAGPQLRPDAVLSFRGCATRHMPIARFGDMQMPSIIQSSSSGGPMRIPRRARALTLSCPRRCCSRSPLSPRRRRPRQRRRPCRRQSPFRMLC